MPYFRAAALCRGPDARPPAARNSTCAPTSTDWRPWFRPGVTRPQKRGRSGVWEGVLCRSHQKVTNVGGCEEIFTTFSTHHVESFSRERLPFGRRTRTTQEKLISESYEVTGPRGPVRAKGDILLHNDCLLHNVNLLLLRTWARGTWHETDQHEHVQISK